MTEEEEYINSCSDSGCVLGAKGGMMTNGGCKHLKRHGVEWTKQTHYMAKEIQRLRKRIEELEEEIERICLDYL